jgi:hypothetical protein
MIRRASPSPLGRRELRALFASSLLLALSATASAQEKAHEAPQPPCDAAPYPAFPDADAAPVVRYWSDRDLPADWRPPACAGWRGGAFKVVVALAGAFRSDGDVKALLTRFGAVSAGRGIRYWSVNERAWGVLVEDSFALSAADLTQRRADFTAEEMESGQDLYFAQKDNRSSGPVVFRMRVHALTPERLTIAIENVSPVRVYFVTVFGPGDLQSVYYLERLSPDVWGYYSLGGVAEDASFLARGHASSYISRAVAVFRHVAGIPTDQEPPYATRPVEPEARLD